MFTQQEADALARVLNHVEERFVIAPDVVAQDVRTLHTLWLRMKIGEK